MPTLSDESGTYDSQGVKQSLGELLGIARGLLADRELGDAEIRFLRDWLDQRQAIASTFPGNVIYDRILAVLEDGVVTEEERSHLVDTLNKLIEERLEDLGEQVDLAELWFDEVAAINFDGMRFCLTGNFVYGPLGACKAAIEQRGGIVGPDVSPDASLEAQFLVVGGLGVDEWRSGGLGEQIEKAMRLRSAGRPIKIISEDSLVSQLK